MKNKIHILTYVLSVVLVLVAVSTNVHAEPFSEQFEEPSNHLQYNYYTKEITTYEVANINKTTQTWDLFSPSVVDKMTMALNNDVLTKMRSDNTISPASIIGNEDTRFFTPPTSAPYSSVAFIRKNYKELVDGELVRFYTTGTGFLVSDKVLLTAAHCIIPDVSPEGYELIEIRIYFDLDITAPDFQNDSLNGYPYIHPQRWTWSTNWHGSQGWNYDYCVIELTQAVDRPFYFNCIQSSNITNQAVYVSGYPSDHLIHQMTSYGNILQSDYYVCDYSNDTYPQMSGSPVYNTNCVAIHVRGGGDSNSGILFTPGLYNLICSKILDNQ